MAILIDKTIISKYVPQDKNTIWIDTAESKPTMRIYLNGTWSEIAEMRSVVFSMLQQICTDMMCQSRQFDREKCPYYDLIFKEIKADREHMEIEEE